MKARLLNEWSELERIRGSWDALVAASEEATVFQTFAWHRAWWRARGAAHSLRACVLEDDAGRAVAIAPLMLSLERRWGRMRRVLRFIGTANHASDYCAFILSGKRPAVELLRALLAPYRERESEWDLLELANLPSHHAQRALLDEILKEYGFRFESRVAADAPARVLGGDRSVLARKSLKRHWSYWKSQGPLALRELDTENLALSRLDAFFAQHAGRRALAGGESQFADPDERTFYRALVEELLPLGYLRFHALESAGKAVAYHFGFEFRGKLIWYKPSFDATLAKRSPGEALLRALLEWALERGLAELDFTVGDEAFKLRFATTVRTNHRLKVYRSFTDALVAWVVRLLRPARPCSRDKLSS